MSNLLGKYILKDGKPVLETDLMQWASWFETGDRVLEQTRVYDFEVSTVFLGLDHNFGQGKPILWETMVFGGPLDGLQERYSLQEEAKKGHLRMVKRVKKEIEKIGIKPKRLLRPEKV